MIEFGTTLVIEFGTALVNCSLEREDGKRKEES